MPRPMPRLPRLPRRAALPREVPMLCIPWHRALPTLVLGLMLVAPGALPAQEAAAPESEAPDEAAPEGGYSQSPLAEDAYPEDAPQAEGGPAPPEPPMTLERMDAILRALDPETQDNGRIWQLKVAEVTVLVVTDEAADRMRVIAPVREADGLEPDEVTRMMQANFDTALDARYAIAKGVVWSAFIHPLSALRKTQLISGVGQVVNLVRSYGTLYSSGGLIFGGGDSGALQRQLIDELLKKGEEI